MPAPAVLLRDQTVTSWNARGDSHVIPALEQEAADTMDALLGS